MSKEAEDRQADLFTYEQALEDHIIKEYPGRLRQSNCFKDSAIDERTLYSFQNLSLKLLLETVRERSEEYEIRDSKTGEVIIMQTDRIAVSGKATIEQIISGKNLTSIN